MGQARQAAAKEWDRTKLAEQTMDLRREQAGALLDIQKQKLAATLNDPSRNYKVVGRDLVDARTGQPVFHSPEMRLMGNYAVTIGPDGKPQFMRPPGADEDPVKAAIANSEGTGRNPKGSAQGIGQFTSETAQEFMGKYGAEAAQALGRPELNQAPLAPDKGLGMFRSNPDVQKFMFDKMYQETRGIADRALGDWEKTPGDYWAAYMLRGNAPALLQASRTNPTKSVGDLLPSKVIQDNASLFRNPDGSLATAAQAINNFNARIARQPSAYSFKSPGTVKEAKADTGSATDTVGGSVAAPGTAPAPSAPAKLSPDQRKTLDSGLETITNYENVVKAFKPEFLTYAERAKQFGASAASKLGIPLDEDTRKGMAQFAEFQRANQKATTKDLHDLFGATMTASEMEKAKPQFPSVNDAPDVYQQKLIGSLRDAQSAYMREHWLASDRGREVTDRDRSEISITDMPKFFRAQGLRYHKDLMAQGFSKEEASQRTKQWLADKFGRIPPAGYFR